MGGTGGCWRQNAGTVIGCCAVAGPGALRAPKLGCAQTAGLPRNDAFVADVLMRASRITTDALVPGTSCEIAEAVEKKTESRVRKCLTALA
jgi:hypothetical protein